MHDLLIQNVFYVFAALTIFSAIMVVTQRNPVICVLFLVAAFFSSAIVWLLTGAEFLALILVLVYVGAVMTLFLFVVMMLNIDTESSRTPFIKHTLLGFMLVVLVASILLFALQNKLVPTIITAPTFNQTNNVLQITQPSNTQQIGLVLYTDYVFAFELAAVILLVAIVAAITLAHQYIKRGKRQSIIQQIMTRREDRVKLIKMRAER